MGTVKSCRHRISVITLVARKKEMERRKRRRRGRRKRRNRGERKKKKREKEKEKEKEEKKQKKKEEKKEKDEEEEEEKVVVEEEESKRRQKEGIGRESPAQGAQPACLEGIIVGEMAKKRGREAARPLPIHHPGGLGLFTQHLLRVLGPCSPEPGIPLAEAGQ